MPNVANRCTETDNARANTCQNDLNDSVISTFCGQALRGNELLLWLLLFALNTPLFLVVHCYEVPSLLVLALSGLPINRQKDLIEDH